MGFASYCVDQIMSCDPKFRQDSSYLFFLLLVKELIQLKRCKSTYFRQATRLPNMSKADIINVDPENLSSDGVLHHSTLEFFQVHHVVLVLVRNLEHLGHGLCQVNLNKV